jgi:hypothetical protein
VASQDELTERAEAAALVVVPASPTPHMIAAGQTMLPDDLPVADAVYKMMVGAAHAATLSPAAGSVEPESLPDPDPSALIVRLTQLSQPPYDSGVFGGPMAKAAAMLAKQAQVVEQKNAALRAAEEWLSGWASAEPYLSVIRGALSAIATMRGEKG